MVVLFLLAVVVVGIAWKPKAELSLRSVGGQCRIKLTFKVFYRLIPLTTELFIGLSATSEAYVRVVKDWGLWRLVVSSAKDAERDPVLFDSIKRWITVESLSLRADVGYAGDAAITAILTGLATELAEGVVCALRAFVDVRGILVDIRPVFAKNTFRMELAGIASFSAARISVEIFWLLIRRRKAVCRTR